MGRSPLRKGKRPHYGRAPISREPLAISAICEELLPARGATLGAERERFAPGSLVVVVSPALALDDDLRIGERLSPELYPDVVDEQEDDRVLLDVLWHEVGDQAMGELVHQRRALGIRRVARAHAHRTVAVAGIADPLVDDRPNRTGFHPKARRLLERCADPRAFREPDPPVLAGRRSELSGLRLEVDLRVAARVGAREGAAIEEHQKPGHADCRGRTTG